MGSFTITMGMLNEHFKTHHDTYHNLGTRMPVHLPKVPAPTQAQRDAREDRAIRQHLDVVMKEDYDDALFYVTIGGLITFFVTAFCLMVSFPPK